MRWFWWRINAWSEISALCTSLFIAIYFEVNAFITNDVYQFASSPPHLFGLALQTHHKALILVPTAVIIWLVVTLITKPVSDQHLQLFYNKVRPGGFWGRFSQKAEKTGLSFKEILVQWISGVVCVYGALFGIGGLVLGNYINGLILLLVSALSGTFLVRKITL